MLPENRLNRDPPLPWREGIKGRGKLDSLFTPTPTLPHQWGGRSALAMVFIDFSDEYEGIDILTLFLQYTFGRRTNKLTSSRLSLRIPPWRDEAFPPTFSLPLEGHRR
jgi:hypothetical protein